jgi:hypothetical protein
MPDSRREFRNRHASQYLRVPETAPQQLSPAFRLAIEAAEKAAEKVGGSINYNKSKPVIIDMPRPPANPKL